jgi:Cytochrome C oxidase subunit II, transmembrane domain
MDLAILLANGAPLAQSPSIFSPASPSGEAISSLFILVLAITGGIFVVVEGVLIYSIFRFRRRGDDSKEPPQVYGSMPIEIAWTAAPALIVFLLTLILIRTEFFVRARPTDKLPPDSKPLFVTVIGHQWWWEYVYERNDGQELGFIAANELHVPACVFDPQVGRCLPQLLGAAPGRQDRPHSRSSQSHVVRLEPAGPLPGPVCRVLRHAARQHAASSLRRFCRRFPDLGGQSEKAGR